MSSKSRHAPVQAVHHYSHGSRHSAPRHQAHSGYSTSSFSTATQDVNMTDSHYSLSSSTIGSRHLPESSQWSASSGSPPDDYLSNGYNVMNMMMSENMDAAYDYSASNVLPRHTAINAMDQTQGMSQDFAMQEYLTGMDYAACTSAMDPSAMGNSNSWINFQSPPSPPSEHEIELTLRYARHALHPEETIGCEPLGLSKIQPYSTSRHSTVQPRPIRPSSDRTGPQKSSRHAPAGPPSPPEDSPEKVKARKDPLYEAPADKEGYFRCPLVDAFKCAHKPTKQRCIYAKYLDSHLKPYKCRYATSGAECEEQRFSSNACLFRHEREAHGKHGHGTSPYLCLAENCDRAKPDNGFPRSWNRRDHMKRVHQWDPECDEDEQSTSRHASDSRRRKAPSSVSMKRSESSYYGRTPAAPYTKDTRRAVTSSRHQAVPYNTMQTGNTMGYSMPVDTVQFSQYQNADYYPGYSQAVYSY